MSWLLDHYLLHALLVLGGVVWFLLLERKIKQSRETMRVLVHILDRDMDDMRDVRDSQLLRIEELLMELRKEAE